MKRPSLLYFFLEIPRGMLRFVTSLPFLFSGKATKSGNGQPVFVIPGFLNTDSITYLLRNYLDRSGYKTFGWDLGLNTGSMKNLKILSENIQKIHREEGQKITLIGFSLGGVYARELAKMHPEMISGLFTLGSPFRGLDAPNNASWLLHVLEFVGVKKKSSKDQSDFFRKVVIPAPVPTVAMYTKTDGVVSWEGCIEDPEDELHENVEMTGSHFGMTMNEEVFKLIGNRIPEQQIGRREQERMMWV